MTLQDRLQLPIYNIINTTYLYYDCAYLQYCIYLSVIHIYISKAIAPMSVSLLDIYIYIYIYTYIHI